MNNPHSSFAVLAWPFFFSCMCAYVQSLPAPTLEPRRCMLAACPFLRRAPVLRLKRNLRLSKLFFLWTAHQSLRKHYTAVFEVNIQFFFPLNYGWDLLVMALRLSLLIFLNYTYVLQCKWSNCVSEEGKIDLNWLKMIDFQNLLLYFLLLFSPTLSPPSLCSLCVALKLSGIK